MVRPLNLFVSGWVICTAATWGAEPVLLTGGRVEAVDGARLASDQTGIVASDIPWEGTAIRKDALVAQLQDDVPRASLHAAEVAAASDADIRAAANEAQLAKVEWERAQLANSRIAGAVPELEVRRLELAHKQALLKKEQAEDQLELSKRKRDEAAALVRTFQVQAPFSGTVTQVFRHRGEAVRQGDPILEMINVDRIRISVDVELPVALRLKEGMSVSVVPEKLRSEDSSASAEPLSGKITFIAPEVVLTSKTVRVHVLVENNTGHRLIPGLYASVTVVPAADSP